MAKRRSRKPQKGELVVICWADIAGNEGGEPDPPVLETPGYWRAGWTTINGVRGLRVDKNKLIQGRDYDEGWDWYVKGSVLKVLDSNGAELQFSC